MPVADQDVAVGSFHFISGRLRYLFKGTQLRVFYREPGKFSEARACIAVET